MTWLLEDFVNREKQLAALWMIIHHEIDQRILLISGPSGIGKTYLLNKYQAECQAAGIACAQVDFAESLDQGYVTIVLSVWDQFGPQGFEHLAQSIAEARQLGAWETVPTSPLAVRAERPVSNTAPPGGQSGGVDFHGPAAIYGDVVGRDVIYLTQIIQRDDPWVQQMIQTRITAAFRDCLVEQTKARKVVFLFDAWERATTDTRNWLCQHLLSWVLEEKLPGTVAVVAGREVPELPRSPRRIGRLMLAELTDEAVQAYWVERYGLPPEDVPDIIKYSGGRPLLMALLAQQQWAQAGRLSG